MRSFLYLVCYTFCTLLSLYSSFLLLTNKPHPSPALLKSLLRHCQSTPVQGKTRYLRLSDWSVLLLDVIIIIAVIIYSRHLSCWRCRGLKLLSFLKGMRRSPICLNAFVHANHSWSSFIYRSEYKGFLMNLCNRFPNNVLVSKFRGWSLQSARPIIILKKKKSISPIAIKKCDLCAVNIHVSILFWK